MAPRKSCFLGSRRRRPLLSNLIPEPALADSHPFKGILTVGRSGGRVDGLLDGRLHSPLAFIYPVRWLVGCLVGPSNHPSPNPTAAAWERKVVT